MGATVFCEAKPPPKQPSREIVEVLRKGEPARINLGKCLDMGKEEDDIKEMVCLLVYHFLFFVFVAFSMCR